MFPAYWLATPQTADALTGCTVILCGNEAVGGVDVRGSATGSCELETLNPGHVAPNVHAHCAGGRQRFRPRSHVAASGSILERRGVGFNTGVAHVPIVPGAILFDLGIGKADVRPDARWAKRPLTPPTTALLQREMWARERAPPSASSSA